MLLYIILIMLISIVKILTLRLYSLHLNLAIYLVPKILFWNLSNHALCISFLVRAVEFVTLGKPIGIFPHA